MQADQLVFYVNGKKIVEANADPEMMLLTYLRRKLGLTGAKLGCGEGGCGACTVMVSRYTPRMQRVIHFSANACVFPVCALHLAAVTTVEGIGSVAGKLHPVQERIARAHGSQCGFCTPGMVMSMYALLRNNPCPDMSHLEDAFQGNLCRCTGYRPILEGYKSFTTEGGCCGGGGREGGCCMTNGNKADGTLTNGNEAEEEESAPLFQPSEFAPFDPTQEVIYPPELMTLQRAPVPPGAPIPGPLRFRGERVEWLQPSTLEQLLSLKEQHPEAKLVVGNTEVGIEVKFKNMLYPVILAPAFVPELQEIQHTPQGIVFGAACSLTCLGEELKRAVATCPAHQTQVFQAVLEQLRWFAGLQIRNVAALGGNIMTASPISDLNPVLQATGCTLTLASTAGLRQVQMERFFLGYRKTLVQPNEVLLSVLIPYSTKGQFVSAFKQSPRREDDISIVTAAMNVTFAPGTSVVKELKLSYGGVGPTTVLAETTASKLVGRPWGEELLEVACSSLAKELTLDPSAPGGMVTYRRTLTLSLFYKFYLTVLQKLAAEGVSVDALGSKRLSATELYHSETPTSVQLYQDIPEGQQLEDVVGRPIMHLTALQQATGEAVYVDDIPFYENELYVALVTSSKAHARILSIDSSEAQLMPGVAACLFADDIQGSNATGPVILDETVLAKDTVTCVGHIIGVVVADTQLHAKLAAKAVKISYQDLSPLILTIQDAIAAQSFYQPIRTLQRGNLEEGFQLADHILEGEVHMGGQEHFYLETHATLAVPRGEDGEMELFVSTQSTAKTQSLVAMVLGVPANRVVVRVKRMGGGFGGKESRSTLLSTVVALSAQRLGRPVRCMLDRDQDMVVTGGRHPFYAKYKVGFQKSGKVVALDVSYYGNAGNSMDLSLSIMERALFHMENSYSIPHIRGQGFLCKTHLPSNTAFRGFGGPQGMLVTEDWMSDVALKLGLPAEQVRRVNLYQQGEQTPYGQVLDHLTLDRCWDECLQRAQYHQRREALNQFNSQNRWTKRGLAIVPTKFGISFTALFLNQAGALVHIYTDGSVLLTHGGTEMGQGLHTKMVQVASKVLGVASSQIHVSETNTNTVPNTSPTAASASSDLNGAAVKNACEVLSKRLEPYRTANPQGSWKDWVKAAYFDRVNLSANGFYKTPDLGYDFETNSGRPFNYFSYGVSCSEVEVDCLTGSHKNLHTTIVMDVGNSLNPAIDIGQVEGGFMQGVGLFTLEELRYSPQGVLLTQGPGTYKIPAFGDIPSQLVVSLLRDAPNDKAIFSSKAVGEPPLFLAASVILALKDAVAVARSEAGLSGPFRLDSPATPERVRLACQDRFTAMCPPAEPGTFQPWDVRV